MKPKTYPFAAIMNAWTWQMAWRDSRTQRRRLLLLMTSIVMGIAALTAITAFGSNLERTINDQAKTLLGADLMLSSRQPFSDEAEALLDSLTAISLDPSGSREAVFGSMAYFPVNGSTRLAQIRALSGDFPYYGAVETFPADAMNHFREGAGAVMDRSLMLQYQLNVGDTVRVGNRYYAILGEIISSPGQAGAGAEIAPRIYIPLSDLEATGLITVGSRVLYRAYYHFPETFELEKLLGSLKPRLRALQLNDTTVEEQRRNFGRALENLYRFLNLVAFIALLLGCIGVASSVQVYMKQKRESVAILRCLGAGGRQTFGIYLLQTLGMGLIGSIAGVTLGMGVQLLLPRILGDFLPVAVSFSPSLTAIAMGLFTGITMTTLFAMLPLLAVRRISPLLAIRASFENNPEKDPLRWFFVALIATTICGMAIYQSGDWRVGLGFTLGLAATLALLSAVARLIMLAARRTFTVRWPYVWRQSLSNLYRPNNQTLTVMLAIGTGVFLISTLNLTQQTLLNQVSLTDSGDQPNLVLFDIQTDQVEAVRSMVREAKLPVRQLVPIVTMRIKSIKGKPVAEIRDDTTSSIPRWVLMREYRSTYRDSLSNTETVSAGAWTARVSSAQDTIPISLESGIANDLQVSPGDEMVIDVQGIPLLTRVGSIREVNWQRVQPNFFIVFPGGVLEDAPQFYVLVTRAPSTTASAGIQQAIVRDFPNVSAIDLSLVLSTVESILDKISFVIRFMALFSIFTGVIVLVAAVITSRHQRLRESVLLRTLGGTRRQITHILALEYTYLGAFAAVTGLLLSLLAGWALAALVFKTAFQATFLPLAITFLGVIAITVLLGMMSSRGMTSRSPLEILRQET